MAETTTTAAGSVGRLRRILGVGFGLAVTIGGTIGIGILATPGKVAAQLHSAALIVAFWLLGGLYNLIGANCFTELGAMTPRAGGYYVYARRAFGDWVGFAVGWTDGITYCAVLGYVSIAIGDFLGRLVPALAGHTRPLAIAAIIALVAMQWAGVRISSWFQEWATALKFLAFLALCVAAIALSGAAGPSGPMDHAAPAAPPGPLHLSGVITALESVVIAYAGWQSALYFTEEDRDPDRNLPRAMIGGVVAVIVIYVMVNIALLAILPISALAGSELPAADAARRLVGSRGDQVITVLSLISLVPLVNAILMIGTRIVFALGRDGLLWSGTARVNARGTPGIATLITTIIAIALIATGTFDSLVGMVAFYLALNYAICCLALVALRRREPAAPRPFHAWGYPWTAGIVIVGALVFLVSALIGKTSQSLAAIALLVPGLVIHAVLRLRR